MTEESTAPADLASLSYERARDELVTIVGKLEAGNVTLEESLALWERGEALAARCEDLLDSARRRLDADQAPADNDETNSSSSA